MLGDDDVRCVDMSTSDIKEGVFIIKMLCQICNVSAICECDRESGWVKSSRVDFELVGWLLFFYYAFRVFVIFPFILINCNAEQQLGSYKNSHTCSVHLICSHTCCFEGMYDGNVTFFYTSLRSNGEMINGSSFLFWFSFCMVERISPIGKMENYLFLYVFRFFLNLFRVNNSTHTQNTKEKKIKIKKYPSVYDIETLEQYWNEDTLYRRSSEQANRIAIYFIRNLCCHKIYRVRYVYIFAVSLVIRK